MSGSTEGSFAYRKELRQRNRTILSHGYSCFGAKLGENPVQGIMTPKPRSALRCVAGRPRTQALVLSPLRPRTAPTALRPMQSKVPYVSVHLIGRSWLLLFGLAFCCVCGWGLCLRPGRLPEAAVHRVPRRVRLTAPIRTPSIPRAFSARHSLRCLPPLKHGAAVGSHLIEPVQRRGDWSLLLAEPCFLSRDTTVLFHSIPECKYSKRVHHVRSNRAIVMLRTPGDPD